MREFDPALLDGVDCVVHLAGMSNDPFGRLTVELVYGPSRDYSIALARECRKRGVKFIFASSCSVYGRGGAGYVDENTDLDPQTPYSVNKVEIEQAMREIFADDGQAIAFRFATAYGPSPRMRLDLVINMLTAMAVAMGRVVLNSDGQAWRPNVHVLDICEAVRRGIFHDVQDRGPLILNVGADSQNLKIIDIAKLVCDSVPGAELEFLGQSTDLSEHNELIEDRKLQDGVDTRTYRVSFARIRETFPGFECAHGVADSVAEMADLFRELPMDQAAFSDRRLYRLQHMEDLYRVRSIGDDLRWIAESR
jgi:nucleoside-diphosphate-sugar epimerase